MLPLCRTDPSFRTPSIIPLEAATVTGYSGPPHVFLGRLSCLPGTIVPCLVDGTTNTLAVPRLEFARVPHADTRDAAFWCNTRHASTTLLMCREVESHISTAPLACLFPRL